MFDKLIIIYIQVNKKIQFYIRSISELNNHAKLTSCCGG